MAAVGDYMAAVRLLDLTVGAPFWHELPDVTGPDDEILGSGVAVALAATVFGLAPTCWLLGWFRRLAGVVVGVVPLGRLRSIVRLLASLETATTADQSLWDAGPRWANNVLMFSV
jgi:hypothetical protein